MIKIDDKFSVSFKDGYFQVREYGLNRYSTPVIKSLKTYLSQSSCIAALIASEASTERFDTCFNDAVVESAINTAKAASVAKEKFFNLRNQ